MKLSFHGAAETVTGSKHMISLNDGRKLLLDCGMFQGHGSEADVLNRHWGFEPRTVTHLVLSHAHIDHSGLIPKLVNDGFIGKIYCTPATFDLCKIMLEDSARIQESDANYLNKKRKKQGKEPIEALYEIEDVSKALKQFSTLNYNTPTQIDKDITILFSDTGHILGSASIHVTINENNKPTRIAFTGDIGRFNNKILRSPQPFPQADYIITESTYGDKEHKESSLTEQQLLDVVTKTCIEQKGKLIIPSFSVGRTQEIVNMLNNLHFEHHLPSIKVFVDSPLSTNATTIYSNHTECFNKDELDYMKSDPTPFGFDKLTYITDVEESKALNFSTEPCIIISSSGMADAGRVKHHIANNIENANNTILIVGWCSPNSLGRRLIEKNKRVRIFGEEYTLKAEVVIMNEFSAHGDYHEMLRLLKCQNATKIRNVFLVHGELEVLYKWQERLHVAGFKNSTVPKLHQEIELN